MDDFECFKQRILSDSALEGWQGLWEPLWWLHGAGQIGGQTEAEREEFAERALRELHEDGLVYFVRSSWPGGDLSDANRLTDNEVAEMLRAHWWRGKDGLAPDVDTVVWFAATPAGAAACGAPSSNAD